MIFLAIIATTVILYVAFNIVSYLLDAVSDSAWSSAAIAGTFVASMLAIWSIFWIWSLV